MFKISVVAAANRSNTATVDPVKFQSGTVYLAPELAASRLHKTMNWTA